MAALLAAGAAGGISLYSYNRENFMFDKEQKQKREFQEQNMRVEQYCLYREDVRDLVELTVGKMDLYLIMAGMLVDKTFMMVCKQGTSLPEASPEWVVFLLAVSLASAVMYFLLTLWLAMYASISAQSFGTRLLTQFVRLPIAKQEQLDLATGRAHEFEEQGVGQFMRVPVLGRDAQHVARPQQPQSFGGSQSDMGTGTFRSMQSGVGGSRTWRRGESFLDGPSSAAPNMRDPMARFLPTQMLEHIRLYRRVQLNWQAYDAYARVSLFCGAINLLYGCLYWNLNQQMLKTKFPGANDPSDLAGFLPALGTSAIFSVVQLALTRLDLRLARAQTVLLCCFVCVTPVLTCVGMYYAEVIKDDFEEHHHHPEEHPHHLRKASKERYIMTSCALVTHIMHTLVTYLMYRASKPDQVTSQEDALLPGKFRSALYLDVFGWLMNPTGPGPTGDGSRMSRANSVTSSMSHASRTSRANRSGASMDFGHINSRQVSEAGDAVGDQEDAEVERRGSYELTSDVASEANRLLNPDGAQGEAPTTSFQPQTSPGPYVTQGPNAQVEGMGGEAMAMHHAEQINAPDAEAATRFHEAGAPRRVHGRVRVPGETPWRAFFRATQVIICIWALSTLWLLIKLITMGNGHCQEAPFVFWCDNWMVVPEHEHPDHPELLATTKFGDPLHQTVCAADGRPVDLQVLQDGDAEATLPGANRWQRTTNAGCNLRVPTDAALACANTSAASACVAAILQADGKTIDLCQLNSSFVLSTLGKLHLPVEMGSWNSIAISVSSQAPTASRDSFRIFAGNDQGQLVAFKASWVDGLESLEGTLMPEFVVRTRFAVLEEADMHEHLFATANTIVSVFSDEPEASPIAQRLRAYAWSTATGERVAQEFVTQSFQSMCANPRPADDLNPLPQLLAAV